MISKKRRVEVQQIVNKIAYLSKDAGGELVAFSTNHNIRQYEFPSFMGARQFVTGMSQMDLDFTSNSPSKDRPHHWRVKVSI